MDISRRFGISCVITIREIVVDAMLIRALIQLVEASTVVAQVYASWWPSVSIKLPYQLSQRGVENLR